MDTTSKRVVVTGVGVISPIGIGCDSFWQAIASRQSGVRPIRLLAASALPHDVAGEATAFDDAMVKNLFTRPQKKSIKVMCREIEMGVGSANIALTHAGLTNDNGDVVPGVVDPERLGVEFGANQMFSPPDVLKDGCYVCDEAGHFLFDQWGGTGLSRMTPLWLLKYLPNMPACHIGIHADARGPNNSLTMAEASGNNALGEAFRIISRGRADIMLAGSTGSRVHPVKALHARLWEELADYEGEADPSTWCRPFDASRRGEVVGEGACTFVLEEEEHAKARGANIMGTILGAGSSCALSRDGKPDYRQAIVNASRAALRSAGLTAADVGHYHAHGLGSRAIDSVEAAAVHEIFGDAGRQIPVTALKSYTGNSGAACGTLELAASLLAVNNGVVPAVLNYSAPDPACDINVVHGEHAATTNKVVLSVNFTFQGQASAVVACGV